MEPHTGILIVAALAYLFFLSKIIDKNRRILMKKSRIHEPDQSQLKELEKWMEERRSLKRTVKRFRNSSILFFMLVPTVEVSAHLIVGGYLIHDQLLSLAFFGIFFLTLLLILYTMKGKSKLTPKKYTHQITM